MNEASQGEDRGAELFLRQTLQLFRHLGWFIIDVGHGVQHIQDQAGVSRDAQATSQLTFIVREKVMSDTLYLPVLIRTRTGDDEHGCANVVRTLDTNSSSIVLVRKFAQRNVVSLWIAHRERCPGGESVHGGRQ